MDVLSKYCITAIGVKKTFVVPVGNDDLNIFEHHMHSGCLWIVQILWMNELWTLASAYLQAFID